MAKVGYGPKDFDPRDYRAAVRKLCSFLECLERESEKAEHWPPPSIRGALWQYMVRESAAVLDSAYMIAEVGPPDFPILEFVGKLVFQLDRMKRAREAILENAALYEREKTPIPEWTEAEATGVLCETWASIVQVLPEFRAPLKLLELRAEHVPEAPTEVATDSQRPAARRKPGRATKDIPLHVSDALLKRWEDLDDNAPKQIAWAAEAARWLRDEHNSTAPDGELWNPEEVIRFLKNAQERVGRPLRKRD